MLFISLEFRMARILPDLNSFRFGLFRFSLFDFKFTKLQRCRSASSLSSRLKIRQIARSLILLGCNVNKLSRISHKMLSLGFVKVMQSSLTVAQMSSSLSSVFLQHLQHALQHEGTVQNKTLKRAKKTPQPTKLGPISLSSSVRNPLSPRPTKVMTKPIHIIPRPT